MADASKHTDGPGPWDPAAWDPSNMPDFDDDFIGEDDVQESPKLSPLPTLLRPQKKIS
jgi:hypothetical protein